MKNSFQKGKGFFYTSKCIIEIDFTFIIFSPFFSLTKHYCLYPKFLRAYNYAHARILKCSSSQKICAHQFIKSTAEDKQPGAGIVHKVCLLDLFELSRGVSDGGRSIYYLSKHFIVCIPRHPAAEANKRQQQLILSRAHEFNPARPLCLPSRSWSILTSNYWTFNAGEKEPKKRRKKAE
jgi:hypothetical protein